MAKSKSNKIIYRSLDNDLLLLNKGPQKASLEIGTSPYVLSNRIANLKKAYKNISSLADMYIGSDIMKHPYKVKRIQVLCKKKFNNQKTILYQDDNVVIYKKGK